jgi:hypothetical protein
MMILYYRLMTKWIGLGDSTVFSWAGCHSCGPHRGGHRWVVGGSLRSCKVEPSLEVAAMSGRSLRSCGANTKSESGPWAMWG